jgi:dTDP-4-dehydrorhamnose 3,5-epimerase
VRFTPTAVDGVMIVEIEPRIDCRGFFSRSFCMSEFADHGLDSAVVQCNVLYSHTAGTIRGLHLQVPPYREAKTVRCTRGAIADVAVDVRPDSATYGKHVMVELTADNHRALYIPPYVAHGFQTLAYDTEVTYQASGPYAAAGEDGYRYDDEAFGIVWPLPAAVISEKDANWPMLATRVGRIPTHH